MGGGAREARLRRRRRRPVLGGAGRGAPVLERGGAPTGRTRRRAAIAPTRRALDEPTDGRPTPSRASVASRRRRRPSAAARRRRARPAVQPGLAIAARRNDASTPMMARAHHRGRPDNVMALSERRSRARRPRAVARSGRPTALAKAAAPRPRDLNVRRGGHREADVAELGRARRTCSSAAARGLVQTSNSCEQADDGECASRGGLAANRRLRLRDRPDGGRGAPASRERSARSSLPGRAGPRRASPGFEPRARPQRRRWRPDARAATRPPSSSCPGRRVAVADRDGEPTVEGALSLSLLSL